MKEGQNSLLGKYYSGETTLTEENQLKEEMRRGEGYSPEQDMFNYFDEESALPEGLEESLFGIISAKENRKRSLVRRLYSYTSAAAVVIIFLSVFFTARDNKIRAMEDQFFEIERAMFQVSESLQPAEQDDLLVLWADENVEIIIN